MSGNTNGLPNGIVFELEDWKVVTLCQDCIIKLGALDDKGKYAFFKELGIELVKKRKG